MAAEAEVPPRALVEGCLAAFERSGDPRFLTPALAGLPGPGRRAGAAAQAAHPGRCRAPGRAAPPAAPAAGDRSPPCACPPSSTSRAAMQAEQCLGAAGFRCVEERGRDHIARATRAHVGALTAWHAARAGEPLLAPQEILVGILSIDPRKQDVNVKALIAALNTCLNARAGRRRRKGRAARVPSRGPRLRPAAAARQVLRSWPAGSHGGAMQHAG